MSYHSIIEINHDHVHKILNPDFGKNLHTILANRWPEKISKELLQKYGIKLISQHHSSTLHRLIVDNDERMTEADYQTWEKL